jgi:Aspartate oxidase
MPSRRSHAPVQADFLVIGSGVAGLRAALELSRAGPGYGLTKGHPLQSSSIHAQGGVAVAMSEEDDVAIHLTTRSKRGMGSVGNKRCGSR